MRIHVFDRRLSTPPPQIVFRRRKRFSDPGTARVGQRGTVRDSTGQPRGTVRDSAGQRGPVRDNVGHVGTLARHIRTCTRLFEIGVLEAIRAFLVS